jgi:predicted RNA-binding protein with TRAM domain
LSLHPIASAQEDDGKAEEMGGRRLVISSSDTSTAPTILLRSYGTDAAGAPLELTSESIYLEHDGQEVLDFTVIGDYKAGTFTVFVVDTPPGVTNQLELIQQVIEKFASPPEMEEMVDYIAIYQVGESSTIQLLSPTNFYNSIRNFFADPFETQDGPTALLDSVDGLLKEMESLRPEDDLSMSIVLMTDGTDVVSTEILPEELAGRAAALGIPIHTIWLQNENLQSFSQQAGQEYLAQVAAESGGLAAQIEAVSEIQAIWDRIAAFRNHRVIQYIPENFSSGTFEVTLGLRSNPNVQAETVVTIASAAPSIVIDLPPEVRELTLENLDEPVSLSFSTQLSWLDGLERELKSAELIVNGTVVQEIDVRDIGRFNAEISNFNYGSNTLQVSIVDEQDNRATSPPIMLTVFEGQDQVPEDIQTRGFLSNRILRLVAGCFLVAFLLAVLMVLLLAIQRRRKGGTARTRANASGEATRGSSAQGSVDSAEVSGTGISYLEVLESVTRMPPTIDLTAIEHRLGRNPTQSDIAFENDITVSRVHARVILEGNDYRIYDAASTSGTWVNGEQVPGWGVQLIDGDEILLGEVRIRYRHE